MMTSTKAREITITALNEYHNLVMEIIVDKISPLLDEAIIQASKKLKTTVYCCIPKKPYLETIFLNGEREKYFIQQLLLYIKEHGFDKVSIDTISTTITIEFSW